MPPQGHQIGRATSIRCVGYYGVGSPGYNIQVFIAAMYRVIQDDQNKPAILEQVAQDHIQTVQEGFLLFNRVV